MIINHNLGAMNATKNMDINSTSASKSMEKLSSGLRINKAGDDVAGLAISEKMRGQIRGLDQASANAQDGMSMIGTAEGSLNETSSILQRMRELAVQGANETNTTEDRTQIQKEMNQLTSEVSRSANNNEFNTLNLLNGSGGDVIPAIPGVTTAAGPVAGPANIVVDGVTLTYNAAGDGTTSFQDAATLVTLIGNNPILSAKYTATTTGTNLTLTQNAGFESATAPSITGAGVAVTSPDGTPLSSAFTFQVGANQDQHIIVRISDMRSFAIGLAGVGDPFVSGTENNLSDVSNTGEHALDVSDSTKSGNAIKVLDATTALVSGERAKLGAYSNRLEHIIGNLGTTSESLTGAESRIRDVDMAKEMASFSKNNILSQAAQAMLAQANQQPQQILQLLK